MAGLDFPLVRSAAEWEADPPPPSIAQLLKGRSARIVVTMGMPALFYSLYYRSHSVKSLKRNVHRIAALGARGE